MGAKTRRALTAILALVTLVLVPSPVNAEGTTVSLVTGGLDHPRGLAIYQGRLLVGEAGHGGPFCAQDGTCIGLTSRISSINPADGHRRTLVSNLFSVFDPVANGALGIDGVSVSGGRILAIIAAAPQWFDGFPCASDECRATLGTANQQAGRLISVSPGGHPRFLASVGDFNFRWTAANPAPPDEPDSNPYGLLAVDEGAYVADAAANVVDFVDRHGHISVLYHFIKNTPGDYPVDAVPTCVVRTAGSVWVADLSGRLFRLNGSTASQVPMPLIRHVTGCASDEDGSIYLVNMWGTSGRPTPFTGSVVKYRVDTGTASVVADHLNFPNMLAIGSEHTIYVSANSICGADAPSGICAGGGKVLRITVPDKDG